MLCLVQNRVEQARTPIVGRAVKRQSVVVFGLSFLDVLCCGLGASVLLLLVVKHGETVVPYASDGLLAAAITEIQELIAVKTEEKTELERIAADTQQEVIALTSTDDAKSSIAKLQSTRLASLLQEVQQQRQALEQARSQLSATAEQSNQIAERAPPPSGQHLTGLLINNNQVVVLLDRSASMLSSTLVEIIRIRASPANVQRNAEKWVSARSAAMWAVDRMPARSLFQVLSFSDAVYDAFGKAVSSKEPPRWLQKDYPTLNTKQVKSSLEQLTPHGPTDLKTALKFALDLNPKPKQIVVITDGYPTLPGSSNLSRLSDCPRAVPGRVPLLSPECRKSVFDDAIKAHRKKLGGVRVDVILYALEGDSDSIDGYWRFAQRFGGRLLSPVPGWPAS